MLIRFSCDFTFLHGLHKKLVTVVYFSIINVIHCSHDFAHKQDSQLNSSILITVWRFVIKKSGQDSQLNSSAFSHCAACCHWERCIWLLNLCGAGEDSSFAPQANIVPFINIITNYINRLDYRSIYKLFTDFIISN